MSELSGKYKAEVIKFETSTEDQPPYLKVLFKLTEQWIEADSEWELLDNPAPGDEDAPAIFCSYTYWLKKQKKYKDSKMSSLEYSTLRFKNDWGFDIGQYDGLEKLNDATRNKEKILILEADDSKYHKVKWINNLGGKIKEGMVSLGDLL